MQIFKIFLLISVIISVIAVTYSLVRVSKMLWENRKKTYIKVDKDILINYINNIYNEENDTNEWFNNLKDYAISCGFTTDKKAYKEDPSKYLGMVADFCSILRIIICKKNMSPNIYYLIKYLGKNEMIKRINYYYEKIV